MEELFPSLLFNLLIISITFSIILMALIQKIKMLSFVNKSWQVWFLNLFFSFSLGIPFSIFFYNLNIYNSIWVSIFSFIGAPSIYKALKKQNIINYKPNSMDIKFNQDNK